MLILSQWGGVLVNSEQMNSLTIEKVGDVFVIYANCAQGETAVSLGEYSTAKQARRVLRRIMWNQATGYAMPEDEENWDGEDNNG